MGIPAEAAAGSGAVDAGDHLNHGNSSRRRLLEVRNRDRVKEIAKGVMGLGSFRDLIGGVANER